MGYFTYGGQFTISPPLSGPQLLALTTFVRTGREAAAGTAGPVTTPLRAMLADNGGVWVDKTKRHLSETEVNALPGLGPRRADVPNGTCCWRVTASGAALEWDECPDFSVADAEAWLVELIRSHLQPWGSRLDGRVGWVEPGVGAGSLRVDANVVTREAPDPDEWFDLRMRDALAQLGEDEVTDDDALAALEALGEAGNASDEVRAEVISGLRRLTPSPGWAHAHAHTLAQLLRESDTP